MRIIMLFVLLSWLQSLLAADVIRMQNGQILFGKIISIDPDGIVVEHSGRQQKFRQSEILKNEKDLSTLKNERSEIILKDGFSIIGKIENYNEETGMLVNIGFSAITVPVKNILEISDPVQKDYYAGNPVKVGLCAGYYLPAGNMKDSYGSGYNISLLSEFSINSIHGLSVGGELSYFPLNYKNDSGIDYTIFTLQPYLIYHFLFFRQDSSLLRGLVPFASAGFGAGYIIMKDKRDNTSTPEKSELDFAYSLRAGSDYYITENIFIRIYAGWQAVMQESDPFNSVIINGGIIYSF